MAVSAQCTCCEFTGGYRRAVTRGIRRRPRQSATLSGETIQAEKRISKLLRHHPALSDGFNCTDVRGNSNTMQFFLRATTVAARRRSTPWHQPATLPGTGGGLATTVPTSHRPRRRTLSSTSACRGTGKPSSPPAVACEPHPGPAPGQVITSGAALRDGTRQCGAKEKRSRETAVTTESGCQR